MKVYKLLNEEIKPTDPLKERKKERKKENTKFNHFRGNMMLPQKLLYQPTTQEAKIAKKLVEGILKKEPASRNIKLLGNSYLFPHNELVYLPYIAVATNIKAD